MMMDHDFELARQETTLVSAGHKVVQAGSPNDYGLEGFADLS